MLVHSVSDCSLASTLTVDRYTSQKSPPSSCLKVSFREVQPPNHHEESSESVEDSNPGFGYCRRVTLDLKQHLEYTAEECEDDVSSAGCWYSGVEYKRFKKERIEAVKRTKNSSYEILSKLAYKTYLKNTPAGKICLEQSLHEDVVGLPVKTLIRDRIALKKQHYATILVEQRVLDAQEIRSISERITLTSRLFAQEVACAVANHVQRINKEDSRMLCCF
jgi:hypothetical protein